MEDKNAQKKEFTITVNTREKIWDKKEISYEEVVVLAYGVYDNDEKVVYTVSFSKGDESHKEGSLVKGVSVKIKNGMIFNVSRSNKS